MLVWYHSGPSKDALKCRRSNYAFGNPKANTLDKSDGLRIINDNNKHDEADVSSHELGLWSNKNPAFNQSSY